MRLFGISAYYSRHLDRFGFMPGYKTLFALIALLAPGSMWATHIRGGEITFKQASCDSFEYEVTVTLYTNTSTILQSGRGTLSFGDGASLVLPDLTNTVVDLKYNIGVARFKINHVFTQPGNFLVSYLEPNRNAGILNIKNSVETRFYIESTVVVARSICNHPLQFSILPVDKACSGILFSHNPGAFDVDGDSLSYEIIVPKKSIDIVVDGYQSPAASGFYIGFDYQAANETKTGSPLFKIDSGTGTLTWDAPGSVGQYEIAIRIGEWRKQGDAFTNIGYVSRDMQIIVEDCKNTRPYLTILSNICVKPGDVISQIVKGFDKDFDPVMIEVFTADDFQSSPPTFSHSGLIQSTRLPHDTAHVQFDWNITCDLVRNQPYNIIFKITDQPVSGVRLASFVSWSITVVGAPPEYKYLNLDIAKKTLKVEWKPYGCSNAPLMNVWRRVDSSPHLSNNCLRGIPRSLGFENIARIVNGAFFIDENLDPGAKYCYRLVAEFQTPSKSVSVSSVEVCVGPVIINAPALTNVSVIKTDSLNGQILVRWTSPLQIDKSQFPPPYLYQLLRISNGHGNAVFDHLIADTTFIDSHLNTRDELYGYKVVIYSPGGLTKELPADTSARGFYPRLERKIRSKSIYLQWNASVPWSNQSQKFPWHYVYRAERTGEFILIDSVNVNLLEIETGFDYLDQGQYKSQGLSENKIYRYKISTQGVYGNPKIKEPLINFSNEVIAQLDDHTPPCKVKVLIDAVSCPDFINSHDCDFVDYINTISWNYSDNCGDDIAYFNIYYSDTAGSEYKLLVRTKELSYSHHKNSFSGCYKVAAVDGLGNLGEVSDPVCKENCTNVFIPNVFTPGDKDNLNDFFPGLRKIGSSPPEPHKCPRFVKTVEINIFNRWGERVYTIDPEPINSVKEWNGQDDQGKELPSGIYFYLVRIEFDTYDTSTESQKIQGWVSLVR